MWCSGFSSIVHFLSFLFLLFSFSPSPPPCPLPWGRPIRPQPWLIWRTRMMKICSRWRLALFFPKLFCYSWFFLPFFCEVFALYISFLCYNLITHYIVDNMFVNRWSFLEILVEPVHTISFPDLLKGAGDVETSGHSMVEQPSRWGETWGDSRRNDRADEEAEHPAPGCSRDKSSGPGRVSGSVRRRWLQWVRFVLCLLSWGGEYIICYNVLIFWMNF